MFPDSSILLNWIIFSSITYRFISVSSINKRRLIENKLMSIQASLYVMILNTFYINGMYMLLCNHSNISEQSIPIRPVFDNSSIKCLRCDKGIIICNCKLRLMHLLQLKICSLLWQNTRWLVIHDTTSPLSKVTSGGAVGTLLVCVTSTDICSTCSD